MSIDKDQDEQRPRPVLEEVMKQRLIRAGVPENEITYDGYFRWVSGVYRKVNNEHFEKGVQELPSIMILET